MQKLKLFLFLAFAAVSNSFAQCPVAGFTLSDDTICGGDPVSFTNTSTGGSGYQWDFCTGDLLLTPNGVNTGSLGILQYPMQNKAIIEGNDHYVFLVDYFANQLFRFDYGNSFNNPPTAYTGYNSSLVGILGSPQCFDIYNESGTWYAFIINGGNNHLIRVNLGSSISSNTVGQIDDLGTFVSFNSNPVTLKLMYDGTSYYAFVSSYAGNGVAKLDFGSSFANNTISDTFFTHISTWYAYGLDMVHDCENNKFIAYVASKDLQAVAVLDYGPTLAGTPTVVGTFPAQPSPSALTALHEGNNWYVLTVSQSPTASLCKLSVFNLGTNTANITPTTVFSDTVAGSGIFLARYMCSVQDSSTSYCFISNTDGVTTSKITFPQNCGSPISYSTDQTPAPVLFSNGGMNYITLSVTSNNNQVSYYTDSVNVSSGPNAGFTLSAACLGQAVSFTDTSTIGQGTIAGWQWDFGDLSSGSNLQNPTHVYTNDTSYIVTLTATSAAGCSASFSDTVSVFDLPTANFSFLNNQCSETPVQFNDASIPGSGDFIASWVWDFGDGTPPDVSQNPVHTFDTSGTFSVQLVVSGSSGCSDTIMQSVTIKPRPVISFTVSQTCVGETSLFTNSTTISDGSPLNYTWNFGDGSPTSNVPSPSHTYPSTPSTYTVTLIATSATNGCSDTLLQNVRIGTRANPGFVMIPAAACLNNAVQFIDTSTIAAGDTIITSTWDFNDGSGLFYGDTVSHIYTLSGTYNVMLTVTSLTSCDTFITKTITVLESPTANFTFTNVCMNAPMYFYDSSTTPAGSTIDSIIWDFGDGSPLDYGDTVIHGYSVADTFYVTQTVINNFGCSGTITQQVIAYALPVAAFTSNSPACTGIPVNFTNTSSVQNDSITGNLWNFDDGGTSILVNPSHVYSGTQTYLVSLIVTSSHNCQATITQPVTVYQSPTFNFTASLVCLGDTTHFTYVPVQNPGSQWLWDFGDGGSAIIPGPTHLYDSAGVYNVILTVNATNGCSNTVSQPVTIYPKPSAGILSDSVACTGTSITFTDNSSISSGSINQWLWNFGDGSPSNTSQNTSHLYGNDTTYIVTHTVVSDAGCIDSVSSTITTEPMPVASFTPDPTFGSPPLLVQFLNTSNNAVMYQWNFGDGGTDPGTSPSHTYTDTGYFAVTLIATNAYNCSDTAHTNISVLIPYLDLGIQDIHATKLNDLLSLSADLANLGNTSISKFQISVKTETGSQINEQWQSNDLLKPGEFFTYNFAARYEIDPVNVPSFYCIEISQINDTTDAVELNNKKCSAINDLFTLFDIFPNPVNDNITISMNVPLDGTVEITIYNSIGQLMKLDTEVPVTKGYNEFSYSIRNFAKGFYACAVNYRDDIKVQKIVKK